MTVVNSTTASTSRMSQSKAWIQLVQLLPSLLPDSQNDVKAHYPQIAKACQEQGLQINSYFGRLKQAASMVLNETEHEQRHSLMNNSGLNLSESSSSEDEDEQEENEENVSF